MVWLMTTTNGVFSRSASVIQRPLISGMPIVFTIAGRDHAIVRHGVFMRALRRTAFNVEMDDCP